MTPNQRKVLRALLSDWKARCLREGAAPVLLVAELPGEKRDLLIIKPVRMPTEEIAELLRTAADRLEEKNRLRLHQPEDEGRCNETD
jgi:hypothetical protein